MNAKEITEARDIIASKLDAGTHYDECWRDHGWCMAAKLAAPPIRSICVWCAHETTAASHNELPHEMINHALVCEQSPAGVALALLRSFNEFAEAITGKSEP